MKKYVDQSSEVSNKILMIFISVHATLSVTTPTPTPISGSYKLRPAHTGIPAPTLQHATDDAMYTYSYDNITLMYLSISLR